MKDDKFVRKFKDYVREFVERGLERKSEGVEFVGVGDGEVGKGKSLYFYWDKFNLEIGKGWMIISSREGSIEKLGNLVRVLRLVYGDEDVLNCGCIRRNDKWVEFGFGFGCLNVDGDERGLSIELDDVWFMEKLEGKKWEELKYERMS